MKEIIYSVIVRTPNELLCPSSDAADYIRKIQRKLVTSNTRYSQPCGEVV